jgi:hypothetical protein
MPENSRSVWLGSRDSNWQMTISVNSVGFLVMPRELIKKVVAGISDHPFIQSQDVD